MLCFSVRLFLLYRIAGRNNRAEYGSTSGVSEKLACQKKWDSPAKSPSTRACPVRVGYRTSTTDTPRTIAANSPDTAQTRPGLVCWGAVGWGGGSRRVTASSACWADSSCRL